MTDLGDLPEGVYHRVGNAQEPPENWEELVARARALPPMTEEEQKEQRANWAYGQMACMREYHGASPVKLALLREACRKAAGL
jgi:hypothetical protein